MRRGTPCTECGESSYSKGLCRKHYHRQRYLAQCASKRTAQGKRTTRGKITEHNAASWNDMADAFISPLVHVDVVTGEVLAWRWAV